MSEPIIVHHGRRLPPPEGPLPRPLRFLGLPLSAVYTSIVTRRNRYWEQHAPARVHRPVISVGNLCMGGTGKSPVVSWLASRLLLAGLKPAIAMRGYRAGRGRKSDEHLEHEQQLPGVPVIADPDRFIAIARYLDYHPEIDVIILDDGFQHRQLHRDLDIVLVDAMRNPFADFVLPRGFLREPVAGLARAHVVALTRTELTHQEAMAALQSEISRIVGEPPHVEFRSTWTRIDSSDSPDPRDVAWLNGRTFVAACGIGNPNAFLAMADQAGAQLADTIILRDHATYSPALLEQLAGKSAKTDGVLTTAKDWVKIEPILAQHRINAAFHRPRIEFQAVRGGEWLVQRVIELVRKLSERT